MAKVKITTKTCPLCKYVYKRMQKYEMLNKEIPTLGYGFDSFDKIRRSAHTKKVKSVEECIEDTVLEGYEDFQEVQKSNDCEDIMYYWTETIGMFCPKCGIFLSDKICTKYEEKEI